jgi:hypothetical protein
MKKAKKESDNLPAESESKEDLFIRFLPECKTVKEAALKAGYSPSYSSSQIYNKLKSPNFQRKMRDYYVSECHMAIPKIVKLHSKVLEWLDEGNNFKELPKYDKTHRFILQSAGVIGADEQPRQSTINIGSIRELSVKLQGKRMKELTDKSDVIEGELIDGK